MKGKEYFKYLKKGYVSLYTQFSSYITVTYSSHYVYCIIFDIPSISDIKWSWSDLAINYQNIVFCKFERPITVYLSSCSTLVMWGFFGLFACYTFPPITPFLHFQYMAILDTVYVVSSFVVEFLRVSKVTLKPANLTHFSKDRLMQCHSQTKSLALLCVKLCNQG